MLFNHFKGIYTTVSFSAGQDNVTPNYILTSNLTLVYHVDSQEYISN